MKKRSPRHGSMQVWPRVRAKRIHARVRNWASGKGILGFAGYKVGMTHLILTDNKPTSMTKGEDISFPATIIECPPLKVASIRFYQKNNYGLQPLSQINASNLDKELGRTISLQKKPQQKKDQNYDDITLIVYTQPKLTTIGKKKPEVFEISLGGSKEEKLKFAEEKLGKEIMVEDVFKEGQQLDVHAINKGKGFQSAVKRFGIRLRSHKSEKSRRTPGSLSGWRAQGHVMYRVAHPGQTGFHQRTEYNKWLLKIGKDVKDVQRQGGFIRYGIIKNQYLLLKGSVPGTPKRLIKLSHSIRPLHTIPKDAPAIRHISK